MKYIIFGDSVGKGIIFEDNKLKVCDNNAVNIVSKYLDQTIENRSVYGQTMQRLYTKRMVDTFIEESKKSHIEDITFILELGNNDSDFEWNNFTEANYLTQQAKTSLVNFDQMYDETIKKIQRNGYNVIVCSPTPLIAEWYFHNVIKQRYNGEVIMKFFGNDVSNIQRTQEAYNIKVLEVAYRNKCRVLDLRSDLLLLKNFSDYMCADGIHPNEMGYKVIATSIIRQLSQRTANNHSTEKLK